MSKNFLLSLLLLIPMTSAAAPADSINKALVNLYSQLLVYPQEKIYVQADRPYYLNGEKLFFRAFLLQASTLKRAGWSRYIYTELVSPTDSVLLRQQVRVQDDGMFYGHMQLPETLPEGNYRLRAYTRYMENTGEKFFFSKAVYIADPNASKTKIDIQESNLNNKEIALGLKFSDSQTKSPLKPQSLTVYTSQNRRNLSPEKDSWADYSTKLNSETKIVLVDYKDGSHSFKKYLSIPQPETSTNIVSEILLSSELEGKIPNPAWYFGDDPKAGEYADLLMLTHGWRRYKVEGPLQGNILKPAIRPETSQSFSGKLRGFLNKSLAGGNVKMTAVGYNLPQLVQSDANGNFRFDGFEFPDSTAYFFVAATQKGSESLALSVDTILYPKVSVPFLVPQLKKESSVGVSEETMENYIAKASKKYTSEYGIRQVDLPELTVKTAKREKPKRRVRIDNHTYGLEPSRFISPDNIEELPPTSFEELLTRISEVSVEGGIAKVRGQKIAFAINGMVVSASGLYSLEPYLNISDVAQVDLFLEPAQTLAISRSSVSGNPVIAFTTWPPGIAVKRKLSQFTNRKRILPLGYQVPVEFYSPKYDTPEALNSSTPDLRSTIYWKPNLMTDTGGKASVSFYTSDSLTTYSAVVEGIGGGRKLIYLYKKNLLKVGTR